MDIDTNGFEIGDRVRDEDSGFEGVIVGITQWRTGCARASVQPKVSAASTDGKLPDAMAFDVLSLQMVAAGPRHEAEPDPEAVGARRGGPPTRSVRNR